MSKELEIVRQQLVQARERLERAKEVLRQRSERAGGSGNPATRAAFVTDHRPKLVADVEAAKAVVGQLEKEEQRLVDMDDAKTSAEQAVEKRVQADERAFWFRRFHTSLAIAHGGAFAAIGSNLFDVGISAAQTGLALIPMTVFTIGLIAAGIIPHELYYGREKRAWRLATVSAGLFAGGLIASVAAGVGLAIIKAVHERYTPAGYSALQSSGPPPASIAKHAAPPLPPKAPDQPPASGTPG